MANQKFKTSPLFHDFVDKLKISDKDDEVLRAARKELRREIRANFRADFEAFLKKETAHYSQAELAVAHQFGEEKVKFLTQGSYAYNTLNKPQHTPPQEIDLDDGVYFRMSDIKDGLNLNPNLLFSYVEKRVAALARDKDNWEIEKKSTCIRLKIGRHKHIDLPIYIVPDDKFPEIQEARIQAQQYEEFGILRFHAVDDENIWMAHREKRWIKSDPRKIIGWVKNCKDKYGENFLKLCRIMKAWRDYQRKDLLSSICVMRMVDMALENLKHSKESNCELDSLLYDVVCYMHAIMSGGMEITDPADMTMRLDGNLDAVTRPDIAKKLEELANVMRDVLFNEGLQEEKNKKLQEQFGECFPFDFSKISRCKGTGETGGTAGGAAAGGAAIGTTVAGVASPHATENAPTNTAHYRTITEEERAWLRENHPLLLVEQDKIVKGTFQLRAELCDKEKRNLCVWNFTPPNPGESYIEDSYRIFFGLNLEEVNGLPEVWEMENKILEQLNLQNAENEEQEKKNKMDAHIYPNNDMLCLGTIGELRIKIREDSSLPFIVNALITPYFYYHSYQAKFSKEPWPGLAHGDAELLRNFYEQRNSAPNPMDWLRQMLPTKTLFGIIQNQKMGINEKCLCSKKIRVKNCRCGAVKGYDLLRKKITELLSQHGSEQLPIMRHKLFLLFAQRWGIAP